MNDATQVDKARRFLEMHRGPRPLILPNVWDPIGALLMQDVGFPAIATASAALAWSLGLHDGEKVPFDRVIDSLRGIVGAVEIPVSADIESGYAETPAGVSENVRAVLRAGAVGINLEDSLPHDGSMRPVAQQCERIRAAREAARSEGIPLVINARIDVCAHDASRQKEMLPETMDRGKAYREAGADCLYPVMVDDIDVLRGLREGTGLPVNVYAQASTPPVRDLEKAGITRLSLGPGLLRAALTAMRAAGRELIDEGSFHAVTSGAMRSDDVRRLIDRSGPGTKN